MKPLDFLSKDVVRHLLMGIAGSFIVIAFLFYASVNSDQAIHPEKIILAIRQSSVSWFIFFILLGLVGIWLRAIRYRILIKASLTDQPGTVNTEVPTMKQMILITAIRGMVVDLLPARLGEIVYVALLKKFAKTSIPAGLSSLLFAILLDIAVLAPITILLVLIIGFPTATPLKIAILALAIVISFYIGIRFILPLLMSLLNGFREKHTESNGYLVKGLDIINQLNVAVQTTIRAGVFLQVLGLTIIVRSLKYFGLLILFYSVAKGSFPDLYNIVWVNTLGAMIASEMTAALPIPTIMSFGAWEAGGMTFMSYFGAPPQDSLLALIAVHIKTQAVDYGLGLTALVLLFTGRKAIQASPTQSRFVTNIKPTAKPLFLALGFSIIAMAVAISSWQWFEKQSNEFRFAPQTPSTPLAQRPDWMQKLQGFVVWSSNQHGNHDIMIMDLSDLTSRQLTIHPNTETHPRISPDGRKVAFIRSNEKWQSWRDQRPWNVWVLDISSGDEELIAESGTAPSWSPDGKTLYFHRSPAEIWAHDFATKHQTKIYQSKEHGVPDAELLWPSIDAQGRLAASYKDNGRPTTIIAEPNKDLTVVALGCMLTWSPKNDFAVFVSNIEGGKQKNQFNKYDPKTGEIVKWLDLPGELSHEYFPRLDASQKYLVFGASDGAHEPDIEDYEIYIWKTDTDNAEAQRLTFDTGNDSWPDIYLPGSHSLE
ncbi:MAG: hypothetical protein GKR96_14425 [Gammaproteobacteria bacterium]|nr:hypothetical protein [Gammaproteobacteria bacterium]